MGPLLKTLREDVLSAISRPLMTSSGCIEILGVRAKSKRETRRHVTAKTWMLLLSSINTCWIKSHTLILIRVIMTEISHNFQSLSLSVASLHAILFSKHGTVRHSIEIQNVWPPGEAVKSGPKLIENFRPREPRRGCPRKFQCPLSLSLSLTSFLQIKKLLGHYQSFSNFLNL